jgi:Rrf2 family iron-sulfur cluster assembly transcriptional regulator
MLKTKNLVKSTRGAKGGYILEISPEDIKISNIISAVDEEVKTLNCKKESKKGCNNKSSKCITHNLWDQLDQHINGFFEKVRLQDLVKKNQNLNK